jgi:hypothetical protein
MHGQSISLVLTSASSSVAAGGETTISKGLTFHAHRRDELQVVTWSVHNLTYALVSSVNLPIRESCAVCHASAKDKNLIQNLKSRNKAETNRNMLMFPNALSGRIPVMFDIETHDGYKKQSQGKIRAKAHLPRQTPNDFLRHEGAAVALSRDFQRPDADLP